MCGIFGISFNTNNSNDVSFLSKDINYLITKSQKRGSDTFGIYIKDSDNNSVFKINQEPQKVIKRKDFKAFIDEKLIKSKSENFSLIGQTRLVTNGSKFSTKNNQPIVTENVIGVHNGIFVNLELNDSSKTKNYESISIKSDSLKFFEKLSDLSLNQEFLKDYLSYLSNLRGNYSIAYSLKEYNEIFLSSNCGSLYYYHDIENNFLVLHQKKILELLLNSYFLRKKYKIDISLINQCLNETIIFNPKDKKIFKILNDDNTQSIKLIKQKFDNRIFTNYDQELYRHSKLKRCSKCILLETYPYISFDKDGVCNFCNNYNSKF